MASLLSSRRAGAGVTLHATSARNRKAQRSPGQLVPPPISWPVMAIVGGAVTALASWILCAGVTVLGWLAAEPGTLGDALRIGTLFWLLSNGVGVRVGDIPITLVPWGATIVIAFMISRFAAASARKVRAGQRTGAWMISVVTVVSYLLSVLVVAMLWGEPWHAPGRWAAVIAAFLLAASWGSSRAMRLGEVESPGWTQTIIRAALAAQLVMLIAGAAVLVTSLWMHLKQVEALHQTLQPGVAGGIALVLLQLAFAPNAIVWSASYALGSGFSVGAGSVIAPAATQLGMVPGIPLLGALPAPGPGEPTQLWWLAAGAVAGAVACCVLFGSRPVPRFDMASLAGGACGLLAGAVLVGLAWAAGGDLGTLRLADVGPRLFPLLIMAGTTMGLSGLITGLALGLAARAAR
jgi:hypothetical protein